MDRKALGLPSSAILGTAEMPGFTRQLVRVQWRPADPIDLFVIKPAGIARPRVLLYLYGYPDGSQRFANDGWCRRATQDGFAAVGFVSALTAQRFTNRPMKEWFVSQMQESLGTTAHDVPMILDYLATRGDLSLERVGMYGQGSGGTIALLAAVQDPRIAAVDVLDPWGDWPGWFAATPEVSEEERATYLEAPFLAGLVNLDPANALGYLAANRSLAIRLQQVLNEPITPPASKKALRDAAGKAHASTVTYKDEADHLQQWRTEGLTSWLRAQLAPAAIPAPAPAANSSHSAH